MTVQDLENAIDLEFHRLEVSVAINPYSGLMIESCADGFRVFDDYADAIVTNGQGFLAALKAIKPINWKELPPSESNSDSIFEAVWAAAQDNA